MANSTVASIIEKIFQKNGGWLRIKGELSVYYWARVAGPAIAGKVKALQFRNGYLFLQTENPALAHQISLLNLDIIQKYQRLLGKGIVKGIKIKIGPVAEIKQVVSSQRETLQPEETEFIYDCCNQIADNDLSSSFSRFMTSCYLRKKTDVLQ